MYYSSIDIYAFPKAEPCKAIVTGRKRRRAAILTDTPNKIELEEERAKKNAKNKQLMKFSVVKRILQETETENQ